MSKVPARWDRIARAVEIRNGLHSETLILGNGDAENLVNAKQKVEEARCDGAMLGRAIFGNPWCFSNYTPTLKENLTVMVEHTKLFEELIGDIAVMKKHYKAYVSDFPGASELRRELMEARDAREVEEIISHFLTHTVDK